MEKRWRISRRTMLKGMGAAMALPLLDVMGATTPRAAAATKAAPTRLAYIYFPNGVADGSWQPEKVGANGELLKLNKWMSPLEDFKQDIIIPKNMWTPNGNGHGAGTATWLTGSHYERRTISAGGISVDQVAAKAIGHETLLPSLEMSTKGEGYFSNDLPRNTISWMADGLPATREVEPRIIFDRMFRTSEGGIDRSVLDAILEDAKTLRNNVSESDKHKIDEYLDSVRAIEKRLEFADIQTKRLAEAGDLTDTLVRPAAGIPSDHKEYVRLMLDMMVLAFWADATRVSTFMLDHGQSNRYFNFIDNVEGTWHALSHHEDASGKTEDDDGKTAWTSPAVKKAQYSGVTRWHNEQMAYLFGRLKSFKEGDGTLLDNSMIVYGSSLADGNEHGARDLPLLIAVGGGGTIKQGRSIAYDDDTSMSDLHLALLQRAGVEIDEFGGSKRPMDELAG